jgi:hypothetical protein
MAGEENKGTALSTTLMTGSFVAVVAAPLFGSLSDSSRNAMVLHINININMHVHI